jgi:hypothetical protein
VPGQLGRARRGDQALGLEQVLDRHRQPVQRAGDLAAHGGLVGRARRGPGPLGVPGDDRVELRVDLPGPVQQMIEQFPAGQLARGDSTGELAGGRGGGIKVHDRTAPPASRAAQGCWPVIPADGSRLDRAGPPALG